jgi:hypothetical protein
MANEVFAQDKTLECFRCSLLYCTHSDAAENFIRLYLQTQEARVATTFNKKSFETLIF